MKKNNRGNLEMDYNLKIKENIEKLKIKRKEASTVEEMKDIDFKINMCLLRLGIVDYDMKTNEFKRR